jgi:hypothetical protein
VRNRGWRVTRDRVRRIELKIRFASLNWPHV